MKKTLQGSLLLEILIALAIFSLSISAVTLVFFSGQTFVARSVESRKAVEKAHIGLEAIRFIRDSNWKDLVDGSNYGIAFDGSAWTLTGSPDWSENFKRTVSISTDFDGAKHTRITVAWNSPPEGTKSIELYQTVTPLDQGIYGDWTQPCVLSEAENSKKDTKGTDIVYRNGRVYITSYDSHDNKTDFNIFDVSNTSAPVLISEKDTGPGLKSLAVSGSYAFALEQDQAVLDVIDISNESAPVLKKTLAMPTAANTKGNYIMVYGSYAYITTAMNTKEEFYVVDISDPLRPSVKKKIEIGGNVNEISILQNTAYLATSVDGKELMIYDISDPTNPNLIKAYHVGSLTGFADALSVHAKSKQRIYIGKAQSSDNELFIVDASNPNFPIDRGQTNVEEDVLSLISVQTLSFLGVAKNGKEFQVFSVTNLPAIPRLGTTTASEHLTGMVYNANIVYTTARSQELLTVITSKKNGICVDP